MWLYTRSPFNNTIWEGCQNFTRESKPWWRSWICSDRTRDLKIQPTPVSSLVSDYTMWASASWCFVRALPVRVDCMLGTVRQDKQFLCPSCLVLHHTKTMNKICFYTRHRINPSAGLWGDVKPQGSKRYQNCRKASKSRENPSLHSQMWTPVCVLCPRQFAFLTHGSQWVNPRT